LFDAWLLEFGEGGGDKEGSAAADIANVESPR
jgi:penicillin-binding protein 2